MYRLPQMRVLCSTLNPQKLEGISLTEGVSIRIQLTACCQSVYNTNVFGVVAVTKAMLPLLRKSQAGRIVNVSSGLGSITQANDRNYEFFQVNNLPYQSSKAAVNAITVEFAKELADSPIKVIEPLSRLPLLSYISRPWTKMAQLDHSRTKTETSPGEFSISLQGYIHRFSAVSQNTPMYSEKTSQLA